MALYSGGQKAVDIVVTTYNRLKLTQHTIASIIERTIYPYNLHVVDNGSTDGTVEYLLKLRQEGLISRLVLNDYNTGMVMPKAQSFSLCSSPIFVITDCDVIPPKINASGVCWLEESISRMQTDPKLMLMSLAVGKAKAKPWANANGINYCRFMGQTFQFFRQEAFETLASDMPPVLAFERKCDDENREPLFSPIDTRTCNLITQAGYRVGYTDDLWADHIGSGITKFGDPFWGYAGSESVPMKRRVHNEDEYTRHAYVECDPDTNKPYSGAILKRYHTIDARCAFLDPWEPSMLDGFGIRCAHYREYSKSFAEFTKRDCPCFHNAIHNINAVEEGLEIIKL